MEDIKARLEKTSALWTEFVSVEDKIFEITAEEPSLSEEFDESYYHAVALLSAALRHYHTAAQLNNTGSHETTCQNHSGSNETRLPRLNIPIFQGDFQDWQSFFDLFNNSVHEKVSLAAAQKLQYLKGCLKGEPLSLIRHLSITDANYIEALQILIKRYDKKKITINSYIETFFKQPPITRVNSSTIRKLADTTEEIIRGLKAVGPQGDVRDPWLIYIIVSKLDDDSRQFWQHESSKIDYPTLQSLIECLQTRADTLEGIRETVTKPVTRVTGSVRGIHTTTTFNLNCPLCNVEHMLYQCPRFRDMGINERRALINEKSRCYNCLSDTHTVSSCKSKRSCQICRKRHNSLLHLSNVPNSQSVSRPSTLPSANTVPSSINISSNASSSTCTSPINIPSPSMSQPISQSTSILTTNLPTPNIHQIWENQKSSHTNREALLTKQPNNITLQALLPTAIVHVTDAFGQTQPCRVLLDSGSQASFVTEDCVKRLALHRYKANIAIKGVGSSTAGTTRGATILEISSRFHASPKLTINALILPRVTAPMPSTKLNPECWEHLKTLPLADPTFYKPSHIDILIGAEYFLEILSEGKISCSQGKPMAHNTIFGWIVAGNTNTNPKNSLIQVNICTESDIDRSLRKFWEIEELPPTKHFTEEEKLCEAHFAATHQRTKEGRFILNLPFKQTRKPFGSTREMAVRRLFAMESKFSKDPDLKNEYTAFMREYIKLGHMERIPPTATINDPNTSFYMPHHAVYKESSTTTKLRVVFDASAKSASKISLNDNLLVGPTIQDSLFEILIRFRRHSIVFTGDIEKMYRQILIAREDTDFQRIVWRDTPETPIEDYRLLTVTYGTASAPYLATKALVTIADHNISKYPAASKIIKQDIYIDDLMSGAHNQEEAHLLQTQIIKILESAGFHLRKWASNCPSLLTSIPENCQELSPIEIAEGTRSIKLLGLEWCPKNDSFHFKVSASSKLTNSKREMLSEASKIFDPLGWLSPCTIMVKILFQSLWLLNLQWDDPLPIHISNKWHQLRQELNQIDQISIHRWLFTENEHFQLHGFSDASEFAYSAVIYCRTETKHGTIQTNIVCSKTRVAPIKHISIPRLELCGALLLTRLMKAVVESLQSENKEIFYWTDSTNVLWWLSSHPRCWKSYVANRTAEILETTSRNNWQYVPTKENPADCASRGILPSQLHNFDLWWKGPTWLHKDSNSWPSQQQLMCINPNINEEKTTRIIKLDIVISNTFLQDLSERYAKFSRFVRIIARLLQFLGNTKKSCRNEPKSYILSPDDYKKATEIIFKWVQVDSFSNEISCLKNRKPLPKNSKLLALNPFIDDQEILRVGSRIQHANIEFHKKFPIILPAKHIITELIIAENHVKYMHAAQSLMVSTLRQKYWILNCKNLVRQHIHRCIPCTRYKPQKMHQLMGDLPPARVNFKYVFNQTGVDYAGPIWLRSMVGRRSKPHKGYIAIFVCMSSKAVHIELVSDLSTSAFLAALKRFMSRRGVCSDIFSDNGTNFVGAKNHLREIYELQKSFNHNNLVSNFLLNFQTKWHFSPPSGPNFGGLYESAVKSTKFHLRRVLGNTVLNFEEMSTLLSQIEAILNSRPLCSLSPGPDEIDMLTPAHFIIGHPLSLSPDPDFQAVKANTLTRWYLIQQLMQHFWSRFYKEYLTTLHNRSKWQCKNKNIKIDDIILVRDENIPPAQWPLGKVCQTHPGTDGLVRVVSIKTRAGIFKRPITKLVLLPVS